MQEYAYVTNPLANKNVKEIVLKADTNARIYTFNNDGEPYVIVFVKE